ncbi:MAG: hypothetical protein KJ709_00525, partial [Nanoarchaeota archaeon]|nr:hypothetical protein [Nanoarchaeota archaeon]
FGEYQVVYCEPSTMRPGAPKGLWGLTVQATMHSRFESSQQIYGKRIGNESEGRCEKHFETTSHPQTYDKDFQVRLSYDLIDSNDNGRLDLVMARMELYLSDTFVDYDIHFSGRVNNGKVDLEQEPAYHLSHLDAVITSFDPEKDENLAEFGITDLFESTGLPIFNILKDPKQVREMLAAKLTLDYPVLNGYYQSQRAQAEER